MADEAPARILIVDDETAQMRALCNTLQDSGYETVGFASGEPALAAARASKFDLLLADLTMPEMDGITLMRAALEIDPDLVGIIMTGQGTIDTAVAAMKVGALDYILKPFKLSGILPVLSRALAVRRLRLENAALAKSVRQRTAELESANKELEAFSYTVSHDLRAPLRAIRGFSKIIANEHAAQLPAEAGELFEQIARSASQMSQLIEDLLRFSQLGRQPISKRPVDLSVLVGEVLAELKREQEGRAIEIRIGEMPGCLGDGSLLKQVFFNLLANAIKFTRGRNPAIIEVGSVVQGGERVYFVRDNGAGFEMEYAGKLFGVFQRLHTQDAFEGTGVGLSIVQRIIQRHGGRIWAEAEVDKGAAFYFTLPDEA